jgi:16S rRNA (uracil1498-N3)-methyltransferase
VPEITEPQSLESVVQESAARHQGDRLLFSERDGESTVDAFENLPEQISTLTALIGSEGGWTDDELAAAREAGWTIVTLGGRTLRAETAAISIAALLQHRFGDLV